VTEFPARAQHDLPTGIPKSVAQEALFGKYGGFMQALATWSEYDRLAKAAAVAAGWVYSRSCWAAEFCDGADLNWLAR